MDGISLGLYPRPRLCLLAWASPLTKWTALVSVSSLWSFSGEFSTAVATSLPTPPPPVHPPPQYAGPKLVHTFKKRPEMA